MRVNGKEVDVKVDGPSQFIDWIPTGTNREHNDEAKIDHTVEEIALWYLFHTLCGTI